MAYNVPKSMIVVPCGEIDFVAGGIVNLFTPISDFVLIDIVTVTDNSNTTSTPAGGSIGNNASTYDNIASLIQFNQISDTIGGIGINSIISDLTGTIFLSSAGNLVKLNISTPSGYTIQTGKLYLLGYYL